MIQFDKTQPIDIRTRHDFGNGIYVREISPTTFERVDIDGTHVEYWPCESVVYQQTLMAQLLMSKR